MRRICHGLIIEVISYLIALAFVGIFGALASALYFMMKDKGGSSRMVYSLMLRIGLSVLLFLGILIAYYFGLIEATGIRVGKN